MRIGTAKPITLRRLLAKVVLRDYPLPVGVELPGMCWQWTGAVDDSKGTAYGKIKVEGVTWRAHRLIALLVIGDVRISDDVHHVCENPLCINPAHLEVVPSEKHSRRGPPVNAWKEGVPF